MFKEGIVQYIQCVIVSLGLELAPIYCMLHYNTASF